MNTRTIPCTAALQLTNSRTIGCSASLAGPAPNIVLRTRNGNAILRTRNGAIVLRTRET